MVSIGLLRTRPLGNKALEGGGRLRTVTVRADASPTNRERRKYLPPKVALFPDPMTMGAPALWMASRLGLTSAVPLRSEGRYRNELLPSRGHLQSQTPAILGRALSWGRARSSVAHKHNNFSAQGVAS